MALEERHKLTRASPTVATPGRRALRPVSPPDVSAPGPLAVHRTLGNQAMQRLLRSGVIRARLTVSQPRDPYEQEADRLAEQVLRMPEPMIQRKCAPCASGQGSCPRCAEQQPLWNTPRVQRQVAEEPEEEEEPLQAKALPGQTPEVTPNLAARIRAIPGGGQPLPESVRAFFEPRFGHDFSQVRIHTDARAAESARAVTALAYTVGQDIVFEAGRYAPGTGEGRRLLAHELAHVVQQGGGTAMAPRGPRVRDRYVDRCEPEVGHWEVGLSKPKSVKADSVPLIRRQASPSQCEDSKITSAAALAVEWLEEGTADLLDYLVDGSSAKDAATKRALNRNFGSDDKDTARLVWLRLEVILDSIKRRTQASTQSPGWAPSSACSGGDDPECEGVIAYVPGRAGTYWITFCPTFFGHPDEWRAATVIHEVAHTLGAEVKDRAYTFTRVFPHLSTEEALRNAESHSQLAWELVKGPVPIPGRIPVPPEDVFEDCHGESGGSIWDWRPSLRKALARAEDWNEYASMAEAAELSQVMTSLNITEGVAAVMHAFSSVRSKLSSPMSFECEPEGGGRCDEGAAVYWYAIGDCHICPAWKIDFSRSETRATETMLAGLYGYLASVTGNARRQNYAKIAREASARLTARIFPGPEILDQERFLAIRLINDVRPECRGIVDFRTTRSRISTCGPLPVCGPIRFNVRFFVDAPERPHLDTQTPRIVTAKFLITRAGEPAVPVFDETDNEATYAGMNRALETSKIPDSIEVRTPEPATLSVFLSLKDPAGVVVHSDRIVLQPSCRGRAGRE